MKKLILAVVVLSFVMAGAAFADDEDTPKIRDTDQFTQYQDDEREPSIKALIGSDQLPIVEQGIREPNFGVIPDVDASKELQKQTPASVRSPSTSLIPAIDPANPADPEAPDTVVKVQEFEGDPDVKYYYETSSGKTGQGGGGIGEIRQMQSPGSASPPINPTSPDPA